MHKPHESELAETTLADLGELAGPLIHEVNTLLHTLTLQMALNDKAPGQPSPGDFQAVRKQIAHVADVVKRFHQVRNRDGSECVAIDANAALCDAVGVLQTTHSDHGIAPIELVTGNKKTQKADVVAICLQLEENLPQFSAKVGDIRRLWRFLLANALRAISLGSPAVIASTARHESSVLLQVSDSGANVPDGELLRVFEPGRAKREGMCCLELAACRSIVRRCQGRISALNNAGGGLTITATIPANPRC